MLRLGLESRDQRAVKIVLFILVSVNIMQRVFVAYTVFHD